MVVMFDFNNIISLELFESHYWCHSLIQQIHFSIHSLSLHMSAIKSSNRQWQMNNFLFLLMEHVILFLYLLGLKLAIITHLRLVLMVKLISLRLPCLWKAVLRFMVMTILIHFHLRSRLLMFACSSPWLLLCFLGLYNYWILRMSFLIMILTRKCIRSKHLDLLLGGVWLNV